MHNPDFYTFESLWHPLIPDTRLAAGTPADDGCRCTIASLGIQAGAPDWVWEHDELAVVAPAQVAGR